MKLTRKELYDLVWSEPMTTVCKRFGITDNGLRKHCKSMNIPTPPIGYWAKLQNGKTVEKIQLPDDYVEKKQNVDLRDVEPSEAKSDEKIVDLLPRVNKQKELEQQLLNEKGDCFVVPEVLYAKDALIIDTKEKFRLSKESSSDNNYLKRSPYKNTIKETLDIFVSEKSIDRALSIFSTIIKALRYRGYNIKINKESTYAIVAEEEFHINITERKKQNRNSNNPYDNNNNIFCGELRFNIFYTSYGGWRGINTSTKTYQDTEHTRLENKIISIIAFMEIKAEEIKIERVEAEQRRIQQEEDERRRKELEEIRRIELEKLEAKRKAELKEFQSLFTMADRLYKANIIRDYIHKYEDFLKENNIEEEAILEKIVWAKEKADWLDPFIAKSDEYLDHYDKDEITQLKYSKQQTYQEYQSRQESFSSGYNFWEKPWWRKKR
jgi:hypothetical protein